MLKKVLYIFFIYIYLVKLSLAGFIYQDFESDAKKNFDNYAVSLNAKLCLTDTIEEIKLHSKVLKIESNELWNVVEIEKKEDITDLNDIDRFSFKIRALPFNKTDNNVGIRFFDQSKYMSGFEIWTDHTTIYNKLVKLDILTTQFPKDFDFHSITKISITNYWQGLYYIDDLHFIRDSITFQTFEKNQKNNFSLSDIAWIWNKNDTISLSNDNEPVYEGEHSVKIISQDNWGGIGIKSEYKKFIPDKSDSFSYWNVDFKPEQNNRLIIHIYPIPANKEDIFFYVQFYDNEKHSSVDNKISVLTKEKAIFGKWNRIEIPFSSLPPTLNLKDINKIQLQFYYPGTYYIDAVKITGEIPKIFIKDNNTISWQYSDLSKNPAYNLFELEFCKTLENDSWTGLYRGTKTTFSAENTGYYRVRYERISGFKNGVSYFSEWSMPVKKE